jgi:hypothetical protein
VRSQQQRELVNITSIMGDCGDQPAPTRRSSRRSPTPQTKSSMRWPPDLRDSIAFKVAHAYGLRRRELTMLESVGFGPNLHVAVSHAAGGLGKQLDCWERSRPSTVEHRPADLVSQPLILQDEFANRIRKLFALPTALEPAGALTLASRGRRTRGLDRVGRSTELVCGDMRHHRRLAGSKCGVPSGSAQLSCRSHGMATRRTGLGHLDLASRPCPNLLDRQTGPPVRRLHRLEEVQNVLCAHGSPQSQEPMVGVRERPPAADGDEAGVAISWQDHGSTVPECICPTWPRAMLVVPDRATR